MALLALSFDADQTLWDYRQVQQMALASTIAVMERDGIVERSSVDPSELQRVRDLVAAEHRGRPHSLEAVREESLVRFLQRRGHRRATSMGKRLAEHFLQTRFEHIRLYPEVADVMVRLKQRYRLGLLTNGNTYPDRCGLPNTFDAVVLGPSHGFEKPDVRAFETLADLLGVELGQIAHVGDDWDDIQGANQAGCRSILIDRAGTHPEHRKDAAHTVRDLCELEALLDALL